MNGLSEIVDALEFKLEKLAQKLDRLQKENLELKEDISRSALALNRQNEEFIMLKQQNESLRMANSLLGSDDNKRDTKLKINSLIREIDYCIAQLSD